MRYVFTDFFEGKPVYFIIDAVEVIIPLFVKIFPCWESLFGEVFNAKSGNFLFLRWYTGVRVEWSDMRILFGMICSRLLAIYCEGVCKYLQKRWVFASPPLCIKRIINIIFDSFHIFHQGYNYIHHNLPWPHQKNKPALL